MNIQFIRLLAVIFILAVLILSGCKKNTPSLMFESQTKSVMVLMKASAVKTTGTTLNNVPVTGGTVNIARALIHIKEIEIEKNFDHKGEQEGEHDDGDKEGDSENEDKDAEEITMKGPFTLDISSGEAFIDSVHVSPGIFTKVELEFSAGSEKPFNGVSILIAGTFASASGQNFPFSLTSAFYDETEAVLAEGGLEVNAETTVTLTVLFNLADWFSGIDFSSVQLSDGKIIINSSNNKNILTQFENNLDKNIEVVEKGEHED